MYLCSGIMRTIKNTQVRNKAIIFTNNNELVRVMPERVIYVESDGNYSTMMLQDKSEQVFTMNLAHCQQLIEEQLGEEAAVFVRLGKSLIINHSHIFKINVSKQELWMSDAQVNQAFKLSASREALKQLKSWLEKERKETKK